MKKRYQQPGIIDFRPIKFETAQSWNSGNGNLDHHGTGLDPGSEGPNPGQGTNGPPGQGKKNGK